MGTGVFAKPIVGAKAQTVMGKCVLAKPFVGTDARNHDGNNVFGESSFRNICLKPLWEHTFSQNLALLALTHVWLAALFGNQPDVLSAEQPLSSYTYIDNPFQDFKVEGTF